MKLNKLSQALLASGICLAAATAYADTTTLPNQPNASTGTAGVTLTNTATPTVVTATPLQAVPSVSTNTTTGAVTTTVQTKTFVTSNPNLGTTQGTFGGAGGVSYSGTVYTNTKVATTVNTDGTTSAVTTTTTGAYGTGIAGTDHDFVKRGGSTASIGLCTFCHTPHKASSTLLLWNHTMSTNTFQWDVAATTAGTALPGFNGTSYSGPSAKCLACHDGSVAIGDVGWFQESARTGAAALNTWNMTSKTSKLVGASGALNGTHPVAIPYPLNGAPNVYNGSTTGARLATNDFVADPTQNNMRLYSDVGGGTIVGKVQPGKSGIECSSCHDPHNKAAVDRYFLRGMFTGASQASGYICLQCHIK